MKKIIIVMIVILIVILSSTAYTEEVELIGDIQIIIDFEWGHSIGLFLPPDRDNDFMIQAAVALGGEDAVIDYDYEDEYEQMVMISAPNLITQKGNKKLFTRDLTELIDLVERAGYDFSAYLVKSHTYGVFAYTVDAVDFNQQPLTLAGSDEWEIWWEIPLESPGFQANLDLDINLSWSAFWFVYILFAWFAILMVMQKQKRINWNSRWLYLAHFIVLVASTAALTLAGWMEIFQFQQLNPDAGTNFSFVLILLLVYFFMILTNYMRNKQESKEKVSIKEYLARYSIPIYYLSFTALLIALALVFWPIISGLSRWLGLGLYLLGGVFIPGQIFLIITKLLGRSRF
jgi:hypothetical protein